MEADCSFLITAAVVLPNGDFQLCVQANDQVSAQSWEVVQSGVITETGQHVRFPTFQGNILNGASMDPHVCGCTAVNAIDFRDAGGAALIININDSGFGANEIFNYEKGFNFLNTRLMARGFNIRDLREFDDSPGVPNNPPGQSAIGIDFSWTNPGNSRLEIDRISFTDFEESGALSYAVRDRIFKGLHTLRADASSVGSINTAGIAGGYDLTIHAPARLEGGSSISQNILLTDGSNSSGAGFGITGNFTAQGNLLEIRDNSITVATGGNNPLNGGIILTSTKDLKQSFTIENNNINLALTNGAGIGVNGARGYCVRQNWIGNFSAATGIALSGGGSARVDCNEVLFKPTGVSVMASTQNTYSGNFLSGNINDMHFTGDCRGVAGSTIRWNQFDFSYQPSLVWDDDAFTGEQTHNSYNSWTGQGNQGGGNVEVQHNAPVGSGLTNQSRFRRPSNAAVGSIHFPNHSLGMMVPAQNNTITSIPDGFCDSTNGCIAAEVDQGADAKENYETIVQDTATWNALTEAQQTYLRQGIYGLLLENPDWLNGSGALSGFKASHDGGFVGQSETLRHDWLQLMDDISAHQATLQPVYDSLGVLADQLQQWFDAIAADPGLEASLQSQMDAAIQQGEVLAAQLQQAEDQFAPAVQATVAQLLVQNAALDGTTEYGWNEKRYNEIALKWLVGVEPDSTAAADLRTIAQTCLPDGGRSVLDARGLCAVWLKEYYDEDNCSSLHLRNGDGAASVNAISPDLRIVPNPADDLVRISLNLAMTEGEQIQVQVFDLNGRQVHTETLAAANVNLTIPVKGWPEGLYVARVATHNKTFSKTFVVQHR
ncbi:MAG: T9SS type A sorting domain-containing protein [Saprospiraceae bacterium]